MSPEVRGTANRLTQPIYDTIQIAVAATSGTFFAIPFGGTFFGSTLKTYAETNLVQAGRLERGVALDITDISLHIPSDIVQATQLNIRAFNSGHFRLIMGGQTTFLDAPTAVIGNAGAELVLFSNITAAVTEFQLNRGVSVAINKFHLTYPLRLGEQESIQVEVDNFDPIVAAVLNVTCMLWGAYVRPVR